MCIKLVGGASFRGHDKAHQVLVLFLYLPYLPHTQEGSKRKKYLWQNCILCNRLLSANASGQEEEDPRRQGEGGGRAEGGAGRRRRRGGGGRHLPGGAGRRPALLRARRDGIKRCGSGIDCYKHIVRIQTLHILVE